MIRKDTARSESNPFHEHFKYGIITTLVALCAFFATGWCAPAWCGETAVLEVTDAGDHLSPTPWTKDYIRKKPYVIYSGKLNTMTILWQTYQTPAKSTIVWGTTTSYGKGPVTVHENGSLANEHQFSHTTSGLQPATKYYFQVTNDGYSHGGSFTTAPAPSTTGVSFYGYGDSRATWLDPPVEHNAVLTQLLADMNQDPVRRQTVLVHLGDYVYNGLNEYLWDLQQFNPEAQYESMHSTFSKMPFMGVLGNHEGYDAYARRETVFNFQNLGELFRKYYPYKYANNKRFYHSFDYGPVHFVVIDTWSYKDQIIDTQQANWLQHDLKTSKKPWKVAMIHTPIWDCLAGNTAIQNQLTPILKAGGVQLVLQGHQHYYSHVTYNDMTYLVLGGGGATLLDPATTTCVEEANKTIVKTAFVYHFARFDVLGDTMTVSVINSDGGAVEPPFTITNGSAPAKSR